MLLSELIAKEWPPEFKRKFKDCITRHGTIRVFDNDNVIGASLTKAHYWNQDTLSKLESLIPRNKDIIEIGGNYGTDTIVYARMLDEGNFVHVFEPQDEVFKLLCWNLWNNGLQDKVFVYKQAAFSQAMMGNMDKDRLTFTNPGALNLGKTGEPVEFVTIDSLNLENVGFIHSDAQGSDLHVLAGAIKTIKKCRPTILYEDPYLPQTQGFRYLFERVRNNYPDASYLIDIERFITTNNYKIIRGFGDMDSLLTPNS